MNSKKLRTVTLQEARKTLGVTPCTLWRLISQYCIPTFIDPRDKRIKHIALSDFRRIQDDFHKSKKASGIVRTSLQKCFVADASSVRRNAVGLDQANNTLIKKINALESRMRQLLDELNDLEVIVRGNEAFETIGTNSDSDVHVPFHQKVRQFEISLIWSALNLTSGNQHRAAELLGVSVSTLNSMIKRYQVNPLDYAAGGSTQEGAPCKYPKKLLPCRIGGAIRRRRKSAE